MPVINFYPRFAADVSAGRITQAIRLRSLLPGDVVNLQSASQNIGRGRVSMVRDVLIDYRHYIPVIRIDGVTLSSKSMEAFARKCGFPDADILVNFYADHHTLPLSAKVVAWEPVAEAVPA